MPKVPRRTHSFTNTGDSFENGVHSFDNDSYINIAETAFLPNKKTKEPVPTEGSGPVDTGGVAVSRVELDSADFMLSADYIAQQYVFVDGVIGVMAKWIRPAAKRSTSYLTQKRDKQGNYCK